MVIGLGIAEGKGAKAPPLYEPAQGAQVILQPGRPCGVDRMQNTPLRGFLAISFGRQNSSHDVESFRSALGPVSPAISHVGHVLLPMSLLRIAAKNF